MTKIALEYDDLPAVVIEEVNIALRTKGIKYQFKLNEEKDNDNLEYELK